MNIFVNLYVKKTPFFTQIIEMQLTQILLLSGFLILFSFQDAFAYVDPGTGSMFIQVIIGALVGLGITLKIYWYKVKEKISKLKNRDS